MQCEDMEENRILVIQMNSRIRNFSELSNLTSFDERYDYLRLNGIVGDSTFGFDRYLNQILYKSKLWKEARDLVIVRDNGCDLGIEDYPIVGKIIVHHMNPINVEDIDSRNRIVFDPEFLICVSHNTHLAIHYGDASLLPKDPIIRRPGDTSPWLVKMEGGRNGKQKNAEKSRRSF